MLSGSMVSNSALTNSGTGRLSSATSPTAGCGLGSASGTARIPSGTPKTCTQVCATMPDQRRVAMCA